LCSFVKNNAILINDTGDSAFIQEGYIVVLFAPGGSFTLPLYPPLKQVCLLHSILMMFERGKELERGRSPLSSILPSPAIYACGFLPVILAGEGSGVRRQPPAEGKQNLLCSYCDDTI
jgi:hypothetical protein